MKWFNVVTLTEGTVSGVRINFLWIFTITVTYNHSKGEHFNIGFGILFFEFSVQLSLWTRRKVVTC